MYILLKVCGGGLVFGVLCYDCDVVGVRHDLCVGLGWDWHVVCEEVEECG